MAIAVEVLEDRHPRLGADPADELLTAARDRQIDERVELEKLPDRGPVGGVDQLHAVDRQAGGGNTPTDRLNNRPARSGRLLPATEDDRIAGGQRDRRRVGGDIRA